MCKGGKMNSTDFNSLQIYNFMSRYCGNEYKIEVLGDLIKVFKRNPSANNFDPWTIPWIEFGKLNWTEYCNEDLAI